ncbi:acyltransferase family protein [Microbacterium sp. CIAB417]|uniref:acyltransferase family protein n=1 Tax=Microbacterium sp. CIAB417 TaxID=2860287 RepID=UPI001FACDC2E|nr:acyltransferase family protein [Microbacterium sp. CIAB417]
MPSDTAIADRAAGRRQAGAGRVRADIQGLRAFAVLAVIADHLLHWPSGGFVGVDVFFVISGFLITGLLLREYDRTERISFRDFYARRVRRIIPAATLVLLVTVVASWILLPQSRFWETVGDATWAFFFLGNWHMAVAGTDYFQIGLPPSPVQHYWSLSVEEQFYFVWPWMMLGLLLIAARIGWSRASRRRLIEVVFILATLASFVWSLHESTTNPTFAYFSTFSRAWELGVGALIAVAAPILAKLPGVARLPLGWVGLVGIAASVFFIDSTMPFPGPWAALPVLSTAAVIAAGTGEPRASYGWGMLPLTNSVSRYVGNISYSLYLWHFPIIVLMLAVLPASSPWYLIICIVGMACLSILSYHFVENAFRAHSEPRPKRARAPRRGAYGQRPSTLQIFASCSIGVASMVLAVLALIPPSHDLSARAETASPNQQVSSTVDCLGADFMDAERGSSCDPSAMGDILRPSLDGLEDDTGGAYECYTGAGKELKSCSYGSSSPDAVRVALVGDSHSAMLIPAMEPRLLELNWKLDTFMGNGCQLKTPLGGNCQASMDEIKAKLAAEPYDLVISTGARWLGSDTSSAAAAYAAAWRDVVAQGTELIVVADAPAATEEALACIARIGFNPADNDCGTPRDVALAQPDPLLAAAEQVGAPVVDMTDYYCDANFCPSVIGHTQVYRDTASHISATFMSTLSPYLMKRLQDAYAAGST